MALPIHTESEWDRRKKTGCKRPAALFRMGFLTRRGTLCFVFELNLAVFMRQDEAPQRHEEEGGRGAQVVLLTENTPNATVGQKILKLSSRGVERFTATTTTNGLP